MCGLVGVVIGEKPNRSREERNLIGGMMRKGLVQSQARGHHATGVAAIGPFGNQNYRMIKGPVAAEDFVLDQQYMDFIYELPRETRLLMGHTRFKTVGDQMINRNNHPILAGSVIGTHNGTIQNHAEIFRRFGLRRFADVDSEALFRVADSIVSRGRIKVSAYQKCLQEFRGYMAAAMVSLATPQNVLFLKGNRPLEMMINRRLNLLIYASDLAYLRRMVGRRLAWEYYPIKPNSLLVVHAGSPIQIWKTSFQFQKPRPKTPRFQPPITKAQEVIRGVYRQLDLPIWRGIRRIA